MITQMTNRLLATVMTFAVSTGVAAHAAQDPRHPLPGVTVTEVQAPTVSLQKVTPPRLVLKTSLPRASSLPQAVETAANHVTEAAAATVDPAAAVRAAFQRDHVALEHLRQRGAGLRGTAHQGFNQRISNSEMLLVEIEKTALASRSNASASIMAMDELVTTMQGSFRDEQIREMDQR